MFYARYPVGAEPIQPAKNSDPGRVRFEALFVAMYGDCNKSDVTKNLRTVNWLPKHGGGKIAITAVNGVVSALENVSRELDEIPDQFVKYLVPTGGTYNCRRIAGSHARSMHAHGAAIELAPSLPTIGGGIQPTGLNPGGETASRLRLCGFSKNKASSGVATGTISTRCFLNIARSFWPADCKRKPAASTMQAIYTFIAVNSWH
ncbi:MAG: hypothetical protein WAK72_07500 [Pseudolabrys sp.]